MGRKNKKNEKLFVCSYVIFIFCRVLEEYFFVNEDLIKDYKYSMCVKCMYLI